MFNYIIRFPQQNPAELFVTLLSTNLVSYTDETLVVIISGIDKRIRQHRKIVTNNICKFILNVEL